MFGPSSKKRRDDRDDDRRREDRRDDRRDNWSAPNNFVSQKAFMDLARMVAQLLIVLQSHGVDLESPCKNPEVVALMTNGAWQGEIKRIKATYQNACVKASQKPDPKGELETVKQGLQSQMAQQNEAFQALFANQQKLAAENNQAMVNWMTSNKANPVILPPRQQKPPTMAQAANSSTSKTKKQPTPPNNSGEMQ